MTICCLADALLLFSDWTESRQLLKMQMLLWHSVHCGGRWVSSCIFVLQEEMWLCEMCSRMISTEAGNMQYFSVELYSHNCKHWILYNTKIKKRKESVVLICTFLTPTDAPLIYTPALHVIIWDMSKVHLLVSWMNNLIQSIFME